MENNRTMDFLKNSGVKLLILVMIGIVISFKDLDLRVNISSPKEEEGQYEEGERMPSPLPQHQNTEEVISEKKQRPSLNDQKTGVLPNSDIREGEVSTALQLLTKLKKADEKTVNAYIKRFSHVAANEMVKYKVPASVTLAQGLLNSAAGTSDMARRGNNHFGINCDEWDGEKLVYGEKHCYRQYPNAWQSFRDHSLFVTRGKFADLKGLGIKDYRGWANGLENANFSFDTDYAEVLIQIIQDYDLTRYDEMLKG